MKNSPVAFATFISHQWIPSSQSQPPSPSTSPPTRRTQEAQVVKLTASSRKPPLTFLPTRRTREAQAAKPTAPSLERLLLAMHFPTLSTFV